MRLIPFATILVTLLVLHGSSGELLAEDKPAGKPNFIVFIADDMAWDDCGAYGHPKIQTPNLN
ncbi:MAG: heparan N-sulfatase, partial [Planctomycetota bacterium]